MTALFYLSDAQIVAAIGDGARIHIIAHRLELAAHTRPALRRRLKRLERDGKLIRPDRLQFDNSHFWQIAP